MTQSFEESPTGKAFAAFQTSQRAVDDLADVLARAIDTGDLLELVVAARKVVDLKAEADRLSDAAMQREGVQRIDGVM